MSSSNKLILVALKYAPVHWLLMTAYRDAFVRSRNRVEVSWVLAEEYAARAPHGDRVVSVGKGRGYREMVRYFPNQHRQLSRLRREHLFAGATSEDPVHVLIQATHLANPVLVRRLRHLFPHALIHYYLHEPTSWTRKLKKGDGLVRSFATYLAQLRDLRHVDLFYVTHHKGIEMAAESFPLAGLTNRGRVLPLPFRDLCPDFPAASPTHAARDQILMLGRADNRRCLDLFLEVAAASASRQLKWQFMLLSASSLRLPKWTQALPNLRARIGCEYSDEEMGVELRQSRFVFNLYRVEYTASGVTPVALMFGVPVIASAQERNSELEAAGCLYLASIPTADELVHMLESCSVVNPSALRAFYMRTFDSSAMSIR